MTLQEEFPIGLYLYASGRTGRIVGYDGFNLVLRYDEGEYVCDADVARSWGYRLGLADGTIVRTHGELSPAEPMEIPTRPIDHVNITFDVEPQQAEEDNAPDPIDDMQQLVQQLLASGITPEALQQAVMQASAGNNDDASPRRRVLRINEQARTAQ